MAASALGVLSALRAHAFPGFLVCFLVLFVTSGIGNGSTYRMVPEIFRVRRDAAAVIGLSSAVGALGGFFVPQFFGASIRATGTPTSAFAIFVAFYATCLGMTWWHYLRVTGVLPGPAAEIEAPDVQRTP
jgi:NNP family nitrate/nitrite transporter-like MFS transporter